MFKYFQRNKTGVPIGPKVKGKGGGVMSTGDRRQGAEIHLHPTTPPMLMEWALYVSWRKKWYFNRTLSAPTWNIAFKNQLIPTCLLFWHLEQGHKRSYSQLQIGLLQLGHSSPIPGSTDATGHFQDTGAHCFFQRQHGKQLQEEERRATTVLANAGNLQGIIFMKNIRFKESLLQFWSFSSHSLLSVTVSKSFNCLLGLR